MAIRFEWYENPTASSDDDEKKRYHARPTQNGHTDTASLAAQIQRRCTLTNIDIAAVLDALSRVMAEHLQEGKRVHLDGLGYFQVTLEVDGEIEANTKRRNTKVKMKTVKFRADQKLKNNIGAIELEHTQNATHSRHLTEEEIKARLRKYFETHQVMTRRGFQSCCDMTRSTAIRNLGQLCQASVLKNIGPRTHPVYVLGEASEQSKTEQKPEITHY